ncbi:hypothetical protein D3C86_910590 [compost metagenome]
MLYLFFTYFGYLVLIINFILYAKGFFKSEKAFKIYTFYLFLLVIIQLTMEVLTSLSINNLYLIHLYFIGQFILLGLFYITLLQNNFQEKIITFSLFFGSLLLVIQYIYEPGLFFKFNLFEIVLTSLFVVVFALLYLYKMLTDSKKYYYITVGIIIYLLTSTVLFLVGNLTIGLSKEVRLISWNLNAFFVVVNQLFILYEWKVSFSGQKVK